MITYCTCIQDTHGFVHGSRYAYQAAQPKKKTPWATPYYMVWPDETSHYITYNIVAFNDTFRKDEP